MLFLIRNQKSSPNRNLSNNKGQVALFVALIFQVLFLFFAMIVNVGLIVHHKINLQSSVDMAAYYGAMKQAELLNSIGHMNYQMRQSWKLLSWRYRILGTAGDLNIHPYNPASGTYRASMNLETSNDTIGNFSAPSFCITYSPVGGKFINTSGVAEDLVPPNESTCKNALALSKASIHLFKPPPVIASFIGFASATAAISNNLRNMALNRCSTIGPFNYLSLGRFMLSFQLDQFARRQVISRMAKMMSKNKDDFYDLDGNSVSAGSKITLERNLTSANKDSKDFSFSFYNSLANDNCNGLGSAADMPPKWLQEIQVLPMLLYQDLVNCESNATSLDYVTKSFDLASANLSDPVNESSLPYKYFHGGVPTDIKKEIDYIAQNVTVYNPQVRFVVGYEKNPWCQAYVGVKASTKPKIPFAPTDVTLTAEAYAKPFGGSIGPWYKSGWASNDTKSSGSDNERIDMQLPLRYEGGSVTSINPNILIDTNRVANYSKYVGDLYGLRSWKSMGYWAKLFYNLSSKPTYRNLSGTTETDKLILSNEVDAPRFQDWSKIHQPIPTNTEKDVLAWGSDFGGVPVKESGIRALEIAAVAPDQFDITYYSIDPNFYENYYSKILRGSLLNKIGIESIYFRPDLGFREGDKKYGKFSVKDQIKIANEINMGGADSLRSNLDYHVLNPVHMLSSWSNRSLFDFETPEDGYFGSCKSPNITKDDDYFGGKDPQKNTAFLKDGESYPGECVTGGRTGYSVKLISKDYLFSKIKAGGESMGEDYIKNKPTDF